jgi:Putative zinc-binding metallo-peptidase
MTFLRKWYLMPDEELLEVRLRDLPIRIAGTVLEDRVERLYQELEARGLRFRPHVWLSEEWFTPDGVPGIAIPFYLAHPRLVKLERRQMLEAEGSTDIECMRILRHEAGHALDNAFRLHHKKRWRQLFGSFSAPYPESYKPRPNSRNFVLHLAAWYAQAHPAEDFAETFAVWLTPGSGWRRRYEGWPVLRKLEYVNEVMSGLAGQSPINKLKRKVEPLSDSTLTLREHYEKKRAYYSFEWPADYDRDLVRIFTQENGNSNRTSATSFLRAMRGDLCAAVAEGTGVHQYTIDHLLQDMIERSRKLKLKVNGSRAQAKRNVLIALTVQTMNVVHSGYHRIAL